MIGMIDDRYRYFKRPLPLLPFSPVPLMNGRMGDGGKLAVAEHLLWVFFLMYL